MSSTIKTFLIQLTIFLVVGEILSRLFIPSIHTAQHLHFNTTEIDADLGWKTKANHQFKDTINDAAGKEYTIDYQTYENGFRSKLEGLTSSQAVNSKEKKIQGLTESQTLKRPKVWFIGDSYTQAVEVGNDKTFYSLLGKKLPIEVSAYGASGFSTLQQLMIFEKYVNVIKPDLVVWQFCSNDFIDNYHELEMEAQYKIGVRRPYLTLDGNTTYITPIPTLIQWSKYSRLMYAIYLLKEKVKGKFFPKERIAEEKISDHHEKIKYKHYDTSYRITDLILKKLKKSLPKETQILFFPADAYNPQMNDFSQICLDNQLTVDQAVAHQLNAARYDREEVVFTYDNYHWNNRGHEVVADALLEKISSMLGLENDEL